MAVVMNSDVGSQMFASPLKCKYRGLYDLPFSYMYAERGTTEQRMSHPEIYDAPTSEEISVSL